MLRAALLVLVGVVRARRVRRELVLRLGGELLGLVDRLLERGAQRAFLVALEDLAVAGVDDHLGLAALARALHVERIDQAALLGLEAALGDRGSGTGSAERRLARVGFLHLR